MVDLCCRFVMGQTDGPSHRSVPLTGAGVVHLEHSQRDEELGRDSGALNLQGVVPVDVTKRLLM